MSISVEEIIEATGGQLLMDDHKTFSGVSIDSRTITEGEMFFAIKGDNFDGHKFVESALIKGSGAVVDMKPEKLPEGKVIIYVNDTLKSLQDLAHFLRERRDIPVVAITGSNGKTTTKEMLYTVLSGKFRTLKNEGNLNNHIGLPLTLTRLVPEDEAVILEMGMNASGEIRRLCEIAVPDYGVITNVGSAHVGRLGSYDEVRKAKLEILGGLGTAIVNADDTNLMQGLRNMNDFRGQILTFGIKSDADVTAGDVIATENGIGFSLKSNDKKSVSVRLNVHGFFNVYNALAAAAVAIRLGMTLEEIKTAMETFRAYTMRFEVIKKSGITVINDAYNANPSSMEESIIELKRMAPEGRSVAVFGDMGELGGYSTEAHMEIGRVLSDAGVDVFVAVGEKMRLASDEIMKIGTGIPLPEVHNFKDAETAGHSIMKILKHGDTVLLKGSRVMGIETIAGRIADAI